MPVSDDLKQAMENHGFKTSWAIVPNVVDTDLFYPLPDKINHPKIRIIHVSMLDEQQKNISGLLRVICKLAEKRNDFEVHIVGDAPGRALLEQVVAAKGLLNEQVFFSGLKQQKELAALLRQSDFFVLFSNYENQPCVLIESIASGVPVIATNVGGIAEFISDKQGIVIEPKDETALEKAMEWMLNNYATFSAGEMLKYAEERFSPVTVGNSFYQVYLNVLANNVQ